MEHWDDQYAQHKAPGVYFEPDFRLPRGTPFMTGVPVFLGVVGKPPNKGQPAEMYKAVLMSLWTHFELHVGDPASYGYLAYAVRGFFVNGGQRCYVVLLPDMSAQSLEAAFTGIVGHPEYALSALTTVDLVCAPDLVKQPDRQLAFELQQMLVDHCERTGDRFAILDSRQGDDKERVWEQWSEIDGKNGAVYYPWVRVRGFDGSSTVLVPPCGHIAGVYARSDQEVGVHKAPANEVLEGVLGLEREINSAEQKFLNPRRINCLRSFPGRGIRVWGARTLSGSDAWTYVNVRRIFLTAVRRIESRAQEVAFEPNEPKLWARIERELKSYFTEQFRRGALKGRTPEEAFYVKCNRETNPKEVQEAGQVITEIGLAPGIPFEFVVVRLIQGRGGVSLVGPLQPASNS
jgi:uncharacterized protein